MLWIGSPAISTADEAAGPKLNLAEESSRDEEGELKDDNGSVDALAREFKAQRWDADKIGLEIAADSRRARFESVAYARCPCIRAFDMPRHSGKERPMAARELSGI